MPFKPLKKFDFPKPKTPLTSRQRAVVMGRLKVINDSLNKAFEERRRLMASTPFPKKVRSKIVSVKEKFPQTNSVWLRDWHKHDVVLDKLLEQRAKLEAKL
jgi:hypothetical protein